MLDTKHTPTPWIADGFNVLDQHRTTIAETWQTVRRPSADGAAANAAHIVKCVNAHDELVAALRALECAVADHVFPGVDCNPIYRAAQNARAALAKVQS